MTIERQDREGLLQELESKITNLVEEHTKSRKLRESKLMKIIEEKSNQITDELLREREIRTANLERIREFQETEIPALKESLSIIIAEREEMEQTLLKQTGDEFDRIRDSLEEEQKAREEGEDEIVNYLKEVTQSLQDRISQERFESDKIFSSITWAGV